MAPVNVRAVFGRGAGSLEATRSALGVTRPASLRDLASLFVREVVFDEPIVTGEALGGHHTLTVRHDGSYRYQGHLRATGFPSFEVAIIATLGVPIPVPGAVPAAAQMAFAAHGRVHGTNEPGDREFSWDQSGNAPLIASEWESVRRGSFQHRLEFDTNWFGAVGDVASFLGQVVALGSTFGAAGVAIVVAGEAADLLDVEQLVLPGTVGVVIAAGAAYVLGPGVFIPAFLAGTAVTAALVAQRHLTGEERQFADRVFQGSLPFDRVLLTNLVGFGGRPFTTPGPGGAILVNLGEGYHDPVRYTGKGGAEQNRNAPAQLLIHELTHAWQIANSSFTPAYFCRAVSTALGTLGGDMSAYSYGPAGPPWASFGSEQQASIVDEWFAGNLMPDFAGKTERQRTFPPMDNNDQGPNQNPYYRYIRDNIHAGIG